MQCVIGVVREGATVSSWPSGGGYRIIEQREVTTVVEADGGKQTPVPNQTLVNANPEDVRVME